MATGWRAASRSAGIRRVARPRSPHFCAAMRTEEDFNSRIGCDVARMMRRGFWWEASGSHAGPSESSARPRRLALHGAPSLNDSDQYGNDREQQQQVNEPTQGVVRNHADQPHQEEQNRDRPEASSFPLSWAARAMRRERGRAWRACLLPWLKGTFHAKIHDSASAWEFYGYEKTSNRGPFPFM